MEGSQKHHLDMLRPELINGTKMTDEQRASYLRVPLLGIDESSGDE